MTLTAANETSESRNEKPEADKEQREAADTAEIPLSNEEKEELLTAITLLKENLNDVVVLKDAVTQLLSHRSHNDGETHPRYDERIMAIFVPAGALEKFGKQSACDAGGRCAYHNASQE